MKVDKGYRLKGRPKWGAVTPRNCDRFYDALRCELSRLTYSKSDYKALLAALNRSKTNTLGRVRSRPSKACYPTPDLDRLHSDQRYALELHRKNSSEANLRGL